MPREKKGVVWIAAPAGAGKTCVVTTYLAARRLPALWYNVDARDADAANLFHYLVLAAQFATPRKKLALPAFTAENQHGFAAFARGFFEALYEQRPSPSAIVLDDYHDARSELFDEVVREAIAAVPQDITVIVVSRTEPPPVFARQVAAGAIVVVGMDELRLTPQDIAGLVRIYRPDLRGAPLKRALPRITELANGWAAALTLLLQDRGVAAVDALDVEQFSGRLFDYFATEVLDKATAAQREFLLKTSVAPSLTPLLAARLAGTPDAGRVLTELDRRSFLIQRLGASGSYRYHPLLRGFLLRRAETDLGAAAVRDLHRLAAEALVENGQIDEAMDQFQTAEDVGERTKLLLGLAPAYIATGRSRTIATWIRALPAQSVEHNPWLLYWQAVSAFGHWDERPLDRLERAYTLFARAGAADGVYLACAAAMQGVVQDGTDFARLDLWMERFESLEKNGPPCPEPFLPMVVTGMMLASSFRRTEAAHNRKWADRALEMSGRSNDLGHRVVTAGFLAMYYALYEKPARAMSMIEMLRGFAREGESSALLVLTAMQADATCLWLQGELDACIERVREALAIAARTGVFVWNDYLAGLGVGACLGLEDFAGARDFLEPMAEIAQRRGGWPAAVYHLHASWDAQARGDVQGGLYNAELGSAIGEDKGPPFGFTVTKFLLAQALWRSGRSQDAHAALAVAKSRAESAACAVNLQACLLVESDLIWDTDREHALACLRWGFAFASERGFYSAFGLVRSTLERVTVRALEHGIEPDHVRARIRKHRLKPEGLPARLEAWPWRYRFRLFDSFEVARSDDESNGRSSPRSDSGGLRGMPLRLLEVLLTFGGRGVRDVQIIDALWPDAEGDAGRRVFDTTLHRLRRQLGDCDVIQLNDGRLHLDARSCWLDVWAFDDLVAETERQLAQGAPTVLLVGLARQILGVYRGPLLADVGAGETWVRGPRRRWAAQFDRLAHALGQVLERAGERGEAAALFARRSESDRPTASSRPSRLHPSRLDS